MPVVSCEYSPRQRVRKRQREQTHSALPSTAGAEKLFTELLERERFGKKQKKKQEGSAHDDDAIKLVLALHEAAEDADEVAADGAADAAVVHLEYLFLRVELLFDERIVDADLTELSHTHIARVRMMMRRRGPVRA